MRWGTIPGQTHSKFLKLNLGSDMKNVFLICMIMQMIAFQCSDKTVMWSRVQQQLDIWPDQEHYPLMLKLSKILILFIQNSLILLQFYLITPAMVRNPIKRVRPAQTPGRPKTEGA